MPKITEEVEYKIETSGKRPFELFKVYSRISHPFISSWSLLKTFHSNYEAALYVKTQKDLDKGRS